MCMNSACSSQGLAMAIYTWKINNEVVWPFCFPHYSCLREALSEHLQSKLIILLPKPLSLQMLTNKHDSIQSQHAQKPVLHQPVSSWGLFYSPIFPLLLKAAIVSLSCVLTMSTATGILIHWDYGAPVLPKKPTSNTLPSWSLGSPCPSPLLQSPQPLQHLAVILAPHIAQRSCGCPIAGSGQGQTGWDTGKSGLWKVSLPVVRGLELDGREGPF